MESRIAKAMVMAGENVANDVDEEVCVGDGIEGQEAQEAAAGDRRAIADADPAGQLDISGKTRSARTLRTPEPPTDAAKDRLQHDGRSIRRLVPILCCVSWTKFSAPTSCGEQDGGHSAEVPVRQHVHTNRGREQNSAMYHIRGKRSGVVISSCADGKVDTRT